MKTPAPERAAGRKKLAAAGRALPDGSFVIPSLPYLRKAIRAVGRAPASKRPALKALIRKRAAELKATNAPGVKNTWPFQAANESEAVEMAATATRRMPLIRGAADMQLSRSGPGVITAQHKSTGMKIGTITPKGKGYAGTHATGTATGESGSQQGALTGLIAYHNKMAAGPAPATAAKTYTAGEQMTLDLAGSLPYTSAASSSDGPRVTSMSAGKASKAIPPVKLNAQANTGGASSGLSAYGKSVYAKLLKKKMAPAIALAFAKRADAMHDKAAARAPAAKAA